jgi:ribosome-associated heat shock protein Hsp15
LKAAEQPAPSRIRIDKWLWFARLAKTRGIAADLVLRGKIRINGTPATKPAAPVGPGDVVSIAVAGAVRVMRIADAGRRRGPAPEDRALYDDMTSPTPAADAAPAYDGGGRPTKKARRDAYARGTLPH